MRQNVSLQCINAVVTERIGRCTVFKNVDSFVPQHRMALQSSEATVNQWGNGLAIRLNKSVAKAAGMMEGTSVRITARPAELSWRR
jgi:hypothetical protein